MIAINGFTEPVLESMNQTLQKYPPLLHSQFSLSFPSIFRIQCHIFTIYDTAQIWYCDACQIKRQVGSRKKQAGDKHKKDDNKVT